MRSLLLAAVVALAGLTGCGETKPTQGGGNNADNGGQAQDSGTKGVEKQPGGGRIPKGPK